MAIKILPATPDDAPELIDVGVKAFANDPLSQAAFNISTAPPEQVEEYKQWRVGLSRLRMAGVGKHYFKAVDEESGTIVGYAGLNGPDVKQVPHSAVERPSFYKVEVEEELQSKMKSTREKCIGGREDLWYVQSMLVHPDFQGRGIAKRLLNHAMRGADEARQDVYLEGTAAGQPLYLSCGFEPLADINMLDGRCVVKAMIRHPKPIVEGSFGR